jgi:tape measure domain-containing protein
MATENSRDIELRIAATTSGSEQVKKLASELDQLSKEGGEATPEFVRLGQALDRVAEQGDAVAALNAIEEQVTKTSASFAQARTNVEQLQTSFNEQRTVVEGFRAAQVAAQQAVNTTAVRLREQEAALNLLRAEYQGAERNTDSYRAKNRELQRSIAELENTLAEQKATLKSANGDLRENESALTKAENAYNRASTAAQRLERTLAGQNSKLAESRAELERLGVSASTSAEAQRRVEASLTSLRQEVGQAKLAVEGYNLVIEEAAREEREWAQQKAAAEKAAEYRKLQEARNYVNLWTKALNEAEVAERQVADEARRTAAAQKTLNDAFGVAGVRSAEAIKAEINELVRSMVTLKNNTNVTAQEFDRAFANAQVRFRDLNDELAKTPEQIGKTGAATRVVSQAFGQLAAIYGGFELASRFVEANVQIETLRRSLALVTGSTEQAARQIEILREVSNNAGVAIGAISQSYVKFQAALNGANVPLETTESLFRAVINASGQLGLSSQRTGLILDALAQTASKGVVSLEELRQQLGDSLPGALELTARGLGLSTSELIRLVETGQLLSDDFLPALRKSLVETYGDGTKSVQGFQAAWNRLKNTLTETAQFIGDSGVVRALTVTIEQAAIAVRGVTTAFEFLGVAAGKTLGFIATFDFKNPIESVRRFGKEISTAYTELNDRLLKTNQSIAQSSQAAIDGQGQIGNAAKETGQIAQNAAGSFNALSTSQQQTSLSAEEVTNEIERLKNSAEALRGQVDLSSVSWQKLLVELGKVSESYENQVTVSEKVAAAKKIEGESRVQLVQLAGDEAATLDAVAQAANSEAAALANVSAKRDAEIAKLQEYRAALIEEAARLGDSTGTRKKVIEDITRTIDVRTAEAQKARESAEASRVDAEQKALAVKVYADNSAALNTLRDAYLQTAKNLQLVIQLEKEGLASKADVNAATERAAIAEALYRDAVNDSAAAIERRRQALSAGLSVQEAKLRLEQQEIQTSIEYAKRRGDEQAVIELTIRQKRLEIEIIEAKIKVQIEEVRLEQQKLEIERAALDQSDPLYKQKKQELDIRIQLLEVKRLETAATEQQIERIRLEIQALRDRANASSDTANGFVNDREREATALDRVAEASTRAADAERRRRDVDADGFSTDRSGNRIGAAGETFLSLFNQARSAGLDDATAQSVADQFTDSQGNVPFFDNPGQLRFGGQGSTLSQAFSNAITQAIRNRINQATGGGQQGVFPGQGASQSIRVDINLNGQRTSVNVASQSDATALQNLLRQLQQAAQRSGG